MTSSPVQKKAITHSASTKKASHARKTMLLSADLAFLVFPSCFFVLVCGTYKSPLQFDFITQSAQSDYLVTVSFDSYLYPYTAQAANLLRSVSALLSTLVLIIFLLYILFLIQDQILESTQMQKMNRELQDLNHQLEEMADVREKMGETKERNRLAREIHDTLGHTLTGLSTGLEAAKALLQADSGLALKQLDRLSTVAKEGLRDVRRSVNKLRPDALENHSLAEALKQMIDRFVESTGVEVVFVCHLASLQFQADEEETIYRIVQESMTNSVRHGNADKRKAR